MNIAVTAVAALLTWLILRSILRPYQRYRRKTRSGQEWQNYKARLPGGVKIAEMLFWVVLWLPLAFATFILFKMLYSLVHPTQLERDSLAGGLMAISSLFATLVPAMLLANVASWLLPPIRKANLAAMDGLATASFKEANKGLVKFGSVVVPVSLTVAALSIFSPWMN